MRDVLSLAVGLARQNLHAFTPKVAVFTFLKVEGDSEYMKSKFRHYYLTVSNILNKRARYSLNLKKQRKNAILIQLVELKTIVVNEMLK